MPAVATSSHARHCSSQAVGRAYDSSHRPAARRNRLRGATFASGAPRLPRLIIAADRAPAADDTVRRPQRLLDGRSPAVFGRHLISCTHEAGTTPPTAGVARSRVAWIGVLWFGLVWLGGRLGASRHRGVQLWAGEEGRCRLRGSTRAGADVSCSAYRRHSVHRINHRCNLAAEREDKHVTNQLTLETEREDHQ